MIGRVCGTGSYLPIRTVSNDELSHVMETSDEWIRERTGIRFRHVALEETTSDMAAEAAARALKNGEVNADEIELILTATSSSDVIYPSAACIVQKRIGAQNALAFDLNGACSGFVIAFNTAQAYIRAGIYKTILVVGAESMSRLVDWSDRSTSVLFGDGAGALILKAEDMSRFPINMENYANTSAASIPILLDELVQTGRLRKGQKILLAGFGAGLTWAGSILEW